MVRSVGLAWRRAARLCLGLGLLLFLHRTGEAQEVRRSVRLLLPPFWGPAGLASGAGLEDLFQFCISRAGRVRVVDGRSVHASLPEEARWRGLVVGEATELGRRHGAHVVLIVQYAIRDGRLAYQVSLGDLRGKTHWRQLTLPDQPWAEAHRLHRALAHEVLRLLDPPAVAPEERRVMAACNQPFPSWEALVLHGQARLREWEGEGEAAAAMYAQAGDVAAGFALPLFRQGELFEVLGSRWRAAGAYRRAIQADGKVVEAHARLGDLLAESPRRLFEQALVAYRKAVEIDPDYAEAHVGLADTLAALGQVDDAMRAYRQGFRIDPWNVRAHLGLAHLYYAEKDLFHEAVAEYERALELDPSFLEAHFGLGDMLEDKGLYLEAIARYRRVLALEPAHTGALFAIARAYEKVDVKEAIAGWARYLEVAATIPSEREWLDIARGHLEKLRRFAEEPQAPGR